MQWSSMCLSRNTSPHLPLYRQAADLHRDHGIEISRSTLNAAVMAAGELLLPVAAVLKGDLLVGGYIQADESPMGVQSEQTKGRNHQAYEFQYSRPGGPVVFGLPHEQGAGRSCRAASLHFLRG
jgi:Transposase IS66 family